MSIFTRVPLFSQQIEELYETLQEGVCCMNFAERMKRTILPEDRKSLFLACRMSEYSLSIINAARLLIEQHSENPEYDKKRAFIEEQRQKSRKMRVALRIHFSTNYNTRRVMGDVKQNSQKILKNLDTLERILVRLETNGKN